VLNTQSKPKTGELGELGTAYCRFCTEEKMTEVLEEYKLGGRKDCGVKDGK